MFYVVMVAFSDFIGFCLDVVNLVRDGTNQA